MAANSYEKPDFWSKKAFSEGYPARSVYKLKELDEKFLARVGRRLAGQGYTADVIYFAVNKLRGLKR